MGVPWRLLIVLTTRFADLRLADLRFTGFLPRLGEPCFDAEAAGLRMRGLSCPQACNASDIHCVYEFREKAEDSADKSSDEAHTPAPSRCTSACVD